MKTLDRYIIRNFLVSALLWFAVLMTLRIIADLFVNMDEFTEAKAGMAAMMWSIFDYYRYQALLYFIELGGVIISAAAAFSMARMNQTNELTAMLASGVNLHRVVWPIILCCVAMAGLVVIDQEFIIPSVADKLVRARDEQPGTHEFRVRLIPDGNGSVWNASMFRPQTQVMEHPVVIVRDAMCRPLARVFGASARPTVLDDRPGWLFQDVSIGTITREGIPWLQTPSYRRIATDVSPQRVLDRAKEVARDAGVTVPPDSQIPSVEFLPPVADNVYGMVLHADRIDLDPLKGDTPRGGRITNARFTFTARTPQGDVRLGTFVAKSAIWRTDEGPGGYWELIDGKFFYPTDLTTDFLVLCQGGRWVNFMSTAELTRLLQSKRVRSQAALLTRHTRFTDPINNLIMLLLGLPFILSRERTIKASASRCLLVVAVFYMFVYTCRYVDMPPEWATWLPILVFGPAAVVMYDSVKT